MFNTCPRCGLYRPDKLIDPSGPSAICPECGHQHPFVMLPLLIVSGASGSGKTAVCRALLGRLTHVILLDSDILWRPEFDTPKNNYRDFFETWLRMCKNIAQSGRPVVLSGAGAGVPANIEPCIERRSFSTVEYLALVCDDEVLAHRLRQRPAWRGSGESGEIEAQLQFNRWFKSNAPAAPPITLLDTTQSAVDATAGQVAAWINAKLKKP